MSVCGQQKQLYHDYDEECPRSLQQEKTTGILLWGFGQLLVFGGLPKLHATPLRRAQPFAWETGDHPKRRKQKQRSVRRTIWTHLEGAGAA